MQTQTDELLNEVYASLQIQNHNDEQKYNQINNIVSELQQINAQATINGKITGTISERLCELALRSRVPNIYSRISRQWNWMADFSVLGHPFNLLISVKSFTTKERLLVSGSGNILSPTIGWGLMEDAAEWSEARTRMYLYRSFIGIYLPVSLYNNIPLASKAIHNINGKPLLRKMEDFMNDLTNSLRNEKIDILSF